MKHLLIFVACALSALAAPTTTTFTDVCPSGCTFTSIQAAMDSAAAGASGTTRVVQLECGATYPLGAGSLILPLRPRTDVGEIILRSKCAPQILTRVDPVRDAALVAKITFTTGGFRAAYDFSGVTANSYLRFEGVGVVCTQGTVTCVDVDPPMQDGSGNTAGRPRYWPHHITFDRFFVTNDNNVSLRILLRASGEDIAIVNSYLDGARCGNACESKAFAGINLGRNIRVWNTYLQAESIDALMGGSQPLERGVQATDVQYKGNHFTKDWRYLFQFGTVDPTGFCLSEASGGGQVFKNTVSNTYLECQNGTWTASTQAVYDARSANLGCGKNLLEFKNQGPTIVEGNLFSKQHGQLVTAAGSGCQNQRGASILANQVDGNPGNGDEVRSVPGRAVVIKLNKFNKVAWAVIFGGIGGPYNKRTSNWLFTNNYMTEVGAATLSINNSGYGGGLILGGPHGGQGEASAGDHSTVVFRNNTMLGDPTITRESINIATSGMGQFAFVDNIATYAPTGVYDNCPGGGGNLWNVLHGCWPRGREFRGVWPLAAACTSGSGQVCPYNNFIRNGDVQVYSGGPGARHWNWTTSSAWYFNSDVGFVNASTNHRLDTASQFKGWATGGADPGADINQVEWATACAESGCNNDYLFKFSVNPPEVSAGSVTVRFVCPAAVAGSVDYSQSATRTGGGTIAATGAGMSKVATGSMGAAGARVYLRINCGSQYRDWDEAVILR